MTYRPDSIYIKDAAGLLTSERVATLVPAILENAQGIPLELHSHCTTGMAPYFYLDAARLGVRTLHTAIPPLAMGPAQPSIFSVARNIRLIGGTAEVDDSVLRGVSERLTRIARAENLPIGAPVEYDYAQFVHRVPGGVISNLEHQLSELRIQHRLDEVLEEVIAVQREMGYPIMITPYAQFVVTQAAINVATGERYKVITDEMIRFALGAWGNDSQYAYMEAWLKDRILSLPRARELKEELAREADGDLTLAQVRAMMGGQSLSDEDLLLHYIMKGDKEVALMKQAGPYRRYDAGESSVLTLLDTLLKERRAPFISVRSGNDHITLKSEPHAPRKRAEAS